MLLIPAGIPERERPVNSQKQAISKQPVQTTLISTRGHIDLTPGNSETINTYEGSKNDFKTIERNAISSFHHFLTRLIFEFNRGLSTPWLCKD